MNIENRNPGLDLKRQLEGLPEPQYSYEINIPDMPKDMGEDGKSQI
jgi:hypothetical protein